MSPEMNKHVPGACKQHDPVTYTHRTCIRKYLREHIGQQIEAHRPIQVRLRHGTLDVMVAAGDTPATQAALDSNLLFAERETRPETDEFM